MPVCAARLRRAVVALIAAALPLVAAAQSIRVGPDRDRDDSAQFVQAQDRREVTLERAVEIALSIEDGRVVRADTIMRDGRPVHEIVILSDGRVRTVRIDPATGDVL